MTTSSVKKVKLDKIKTIIEFLSQAVTILGLPLIVLGLFLIFEQNRAALEQSKEASRQTQKFEEMYSVLSKMEIIQLADRAIWNETDGGDAGAYTYLSGLAKEIKSDLQMKEFISIQLHRIHGGNHNLYVNIRVSRNSYIHWAPENWQGQEVHIKQLLGLLKSYNHWYVRSGAASFLGDINPQKIAEENKSLSADQAITKLEIMSSLIAAIQKDPSLSVRLIALKSFDDLCSGWERADDYDFSGAMAAFQNNTCQ